MADPTSVHPPPRTDATQSHEGHSYASLAHTFGQDSAIRITQTSRSLQNITGCSSTSLVPTHRSASGVSLSSTPSSSAVSLVPSSSSIVSNTITTATSISTSSDNLDSMGGGNGNLTSAPEIQDMLDGITDEDREGELQTIFKSFPSAPAPAPAVRIATVEVATEQSYLAKLRHKLSRQILCGSSDATDT